MAIRKPASFRPDIEGIRGLAILLVVLYHAHLPGLTGGYVGVDVFFVLSGYLLTRLLVDERISSGRVAILAFYGRRARRLFPAAAIVLLFTLVAGWIIYPPIEQISTAKAAIAVALYLSNIHFARLQTDYLAPNASYSPFLHTWSLSVEEQFYLVWPFIILASFWVAQQVKAKEDDLRYARIFILLVVSASVLLSLWLMDFEQPWAFFSSATRAWEFAAGGLAAVTTLATISRLKPVLGWCGLGILFLAAMTYNERTSFPGIAAAAPVIGAMALLFSGEQGGTGVSRLLACRPLRIAGKVSYSWYLWHWPILIFAEEIFGSRGLGFRLLYMFVAFVLAFISERWIEAPPRHSRWLAAVPSRSVAVAIMLMSFEAVLATGWRRAAVSALAEPQYARLELASRDGPSDGESCSAGFPEVHAHSCIFNTPNNSGIVVLLGDSHALQWFQPMKALAASEGWQFVTMAKAACAIADVEFYYPDLGRRYTECEMWRNSAVAQIQKLRPDVVFVTESQWYAMKWHGSPPAVDNDAWMNGTRSTLTALGESGAHIVFLRDNPRPDFDVPLCMAKALWRASWQTPSPCTFTRQDSNDDVVWQLDQRAAETVKDIETLDLTDHLCGSVMCLPEIGNVIVYRDSNHLTNSIANTLMPYIRFILLRAMKNRHPPAE